MTLPRVCHLYRLEQAIGHRFTDSALLTAALTHRSHSTPHNERLEFIGDSILNCLVARQLFDRFPSMPEGDLSRLRANLVCQDSLHQLALALSLGDYLRLGEGELKSGGQQRPSMLADALEALLGALWLDSGFAAVESLIQRLYAERFASIVPGQAIKDPKTRLQEYLQRRRMPLPQYALLEVQGKSHEQHFRIACRVDELKVNTEGNGSSRRIAEQRAAESALHILEKT
ncbi:MAG: ribonuclease III [Pseudomonadota bacterium]